MATLDPQQEQDTLQALFSVPRVTVVLEETQNILRIVDENGQKKTILEHKNKFWKLGESVPDDDTTSIVAMFTAHDGSVRVYVQPKAGTASERAGKGFRITVPPKNIAFVMETMNADLLAKEVKLDEDEFIFGVPEPAPPPGEADNGGSAEAFTRRDTKGANL